MGKGVNHWAYCTRVRQEQCCPETEKQHKAWGRDCSLMLSGEVMQKLDEIVKVYFLNGQPKPLKAKGGYPAREAFLIERLTPPVF